MISRLDGTLEGRKGLVIGIANAHSIAYGCAGAFRALGAELAVTYLNVNDQATLCKNLLKAGNRG